MRIYGPLTTESWNRHKKNGSYLHVYLDGVDVTTTCFFADDVLGLVALYVRNAEGQLTIDPDTEEPRRTTKMGKVEIIPSPCNPSSD